MSTCDARRTDTVTPHTCDDPLACAAEQVGLTAMLARTEAQRLNDLLDRIEERCADSIRSNVARAILTMIHTVRGGAA